jgi:hypothetical protein
VENLHSPGPSVKTGTRTELEEGSGSNEFELPQPQSVSKPISSTFYGPGRMLIDSNKKIRPPQQGVFRGAKIKTSIQNESENSSRSNRFHSTEPNIIPKSLSTIGSNKKIRPSQQAGFQAISSNPSNPEEKTDSDEAVKLGDIDPYMWGWIPIITERLRESIADDVKKYVDPLVSALIFACVPPNTRREVVISMLQEDPMGNFSLKRQAKEFMTTMWALNCRTLETMGAGPSSTQIYLQAQKQMMQWFIQFMSTCRKDIQSFGDQGRLIYQKIVSALHFKDDSFFYQASRKDVTKRPILVLERESLMTEAAVHFIAFYYKKIDIEKWRHLFSKDRHFAITLTKFGDKWERRPYQQIHNDIIPWNIPSSAEEEDLKYKNHVPRKGNFTFKPHVLQYYLETRYERVQFGKDEMFYLEDKNHKEWAFLSQIRPHAIPILESSASHGDLNIMIKFLQFLAQKSPSKDRLDQYILTHMPVFQIKLNKLFNQMCVIHFSIIEGFGGEFSEQALMKQKKKFEVFFHYLLNFQMKAKSNQKNQKINSNPKVNEINRLIGIYFLSKDAEKPIFTVQNSHQVLAGTSNVSLEDLVMTKIAVHLFGIYYKQKNYFKWHFIFRDDNELFAYLINLREEGFGKKFETYRNSILPSFKSLSLFPWGKKLVYSRKLLSENAEEYLYKKSPTLKIDQWVKEC